VSDDETDDVLDQIATKLAEQEQAEKRSQASMLVDLAHQHFDLGVADTGEAFGVRRDGPNVALQLRGGRTSLGAAIAALFFDQHDRAPSAAARADALAVIEGQAWRLDPVALPVRVAQLDDHSVLVDLGTADGACVHVRPGAVDLLPRSPVTFRRTALTMPMPVPKLADADAEALVALRDTLNVSDSAFRLLLGWCLAAFVEQLPHPILTLVGEQGTAKSSAGRLISQLVDPTSAPLRSAPRHDEQWAISAAGSWCVVLDNVSAIQHWLSDCLCRAVTGDALVRRQLYSDSDVSVLRFRRACVLTTIDAGSLRGDLAERMVRLDLERIDESARRTEAELAAAFDAVHADVLGVLFQTLADVLAVLPSVELVEQPRMADFARLLAALDQVTGWTTLADYRSLGSDLVDDVVESDPLAQAIVVLMAERQSWSGTATELLDALTPNADDERRRLPKSWPKSAAAMSGALKRLAPALLQVGVDCQQVRTARQRVWIVERCERRRTASSSAATSSDARQDKASSSDEHVTQPTMSLVAASRSDASPGAGSDADDECDDAAPVLSHVKRRAW
jgi:hypothetical protein